MGQKIRRKHLGRGKRWLFATLSMALGAGLMVLTAEVILRLVNPLWFSAMYRFPEGYFTTHTSAGYRHTENFPATWMTLFDGHTRNLVYSNEVGMPDSPVPVRRPNQVRILCLGCSMTQGMGITSMQDPWPRRMQAAFEHDGTTSPTVIAMNAGVCGYNTYQQVARGIELAPRTDPDVWLLAYLGGGTGMWGRNTFREAGQFTYRWGTLWNRQMLEPILQRRTRPSARLMDVSFLWRWLVLKLSRFEEPKGPIPDFAGDNRDALQYFADSSRAAGAHPIGLYLPMLRDLEGLRGGESIPLRDEAAKMAADAGIRWIDLTEPLLKFIEPELKTAGGTVPERYAVSKEDPHYNAEFNGVLGEVVKMELEPLLLDPSLLNRD